MSYTVNNVTLTRARPDRIICGDVMPADTITQEGAGNVRLWWPLLYEAPMTVFTLDLYYSTATPCRLPGESVESETHHQTWRWRLTNDLDSLADLVEAVHDLPFGTSGVPLLSDEATYHALVSRLAEARSCLASGDIPGMRSRLAGFGVTASSACISEAPALPDPTGPGLGIAATQENPACCMLQVAASSILSSQKDAIADVVKHTPDSTAVALTEPGIATLVAGDWFYVQNEGRTSGLKVIGSIEGLQPGGRVLLRGFLGTQGPERIMKLVGCEVQASSGPLPSSLGMLNRSVGGLGLGCVPGFLDRAGLWNGGLRVTVTGRVTGVASGYCYVDDGSGCVDGTSNTGLRLLLMPGVSPPSLGSYVIATGISSWFDNAGVPEAALFVGAPSELISIQTH